MNHYYDRFINFRKKKKYNNKYKIYKISILSVHLDKNRKNYGIQNVINRILLRKVLVSNDFLCIRN